MGNKVMVAAFNKKSLIVKNDEAFGQKCTLVWI